jgi:predicted transcriptional regulator
VSGAQESGGRERGRRAPGALESEVLTVLRAATEELAVGQVRERLPGSATLSYSAVVTTLTRLHAKGLVTRHRTGRAFRYGAVADAAGLTAWRMRRLLDEQADHAPVLTHFIAGLTATEEELVRELLARADRARDQDGAP